MRCFQCHAAFGSNEVLESFPRGDTLAYDPVRGRLWLICRSCRRWSLVPIDARWEALEELERHVRDHARLLAQTDNIALFEGGRLRVVRVGDASRHEEAWWRYGRELALRYGRAQKIARRGEIVDASLELAGRAVMLLLTALPIWPEAKPVLEDPWIVRARRRSFGDYAWRGQTRCSCGGVLCELRWEDRQHWTISPRSDATLSLELPCAICGGDSSTHSLRLEGLEAEHVVRRLLAYHNFSGGSEKQINYATNMIDEAGGPDLLVSRIGGQQLEVGRLKSTERFALEIAVHAQNEQLLAELELAELQARWREEEEIAAIIDGELTPVPLQPSINLTQGLGEHGSTERKG